MKRHFLPLISLLLSMSAAAALAQDSPTPAAAAPATSRPATVSAVDDLLYEDASGQSTATITQVLGSGNIQSVPQNTTLANVRRIRIKSDVFIIEWGDTATTLLPRQFVSGIALNRRNAAR